MPFCLRCLCFILAIIILSWLSLADVLNEVADTIITWYLIASPQEIAWCMTTDSPSISFSDEGSRIYRMNEKTLKGLCKQLFESTTEDVAQEILASLDTSASCSLVKKPLASMPNDLVAQQQIPPDAPSGHVPISVTGDGNCLFHAMSVHMHGSSDGSRHLQLRLMTACELVLHSSYYASRLTAWASVQQKSNNPKNILATLFSNKAMTELQSMSDECIQNAVG